MEMVATGNPGCHHKKASVKITTEGTGKTGTPIAPVNQKAKTGKDQSQAFYTDGDAGITVFGKKAGYFKGATGPSSGVEAKIYGEAGLATVTSEGEYGKIGAKAVGVSGEASLSISKVPEASLYGKAYLANVSSSGYIPIPFTNHKIELGFEADIVSIGGGVVISSKDMRAKFGAHFGIGADLIVGFK